MILFQYHLHCMPMVQQWQLSITSGLMIIEDSLDFKSTYFEFFSRPNSSSGLWLGLLVGLSATITILKEESSYSEMCLFVGTTGFGLVLCSSCLYVRLSMQKVIAKDFHAIYFLPAIITSILFLLVANRGISICKLFLNLNQILSQMIENKQHAIDTLNSNM